VASVPASYARCGAHLTDLGANFTVVNDSRNIIFQQIQVHELRQISIDEDARSRSKSQTHCGHVVSLRSSFDELAFPRSAYGHRPRRLSLIGEPLHADV
jgi:hypothetical protein